MPTIQDYIRAIEIFDRANKDKRLGIKAYHAPHAWPDALEEMVVARHLGHDAHVRLVWVRPEVLAKLP